MENQIGWHGVAPKPGRERPRERSRRDQEGGPVMAVQSDEGRLFGEALAKLGESHKEIVVLDADLAKSTKSELFRQEVPGSFSSRWASPS